MSQVKVLFIAGSGRSGTTILDNLLGEMDGFFSSGELRWLWERGLINGWQCGCGKPVRDCDMWRAVLTAAFGAPDAIDARQVIALQTAAVRLRYLPRLLRYRPGGANVWPELDRYIEIANRLYKGIAEATGARVVVDSSKLAHEAAVVRLLPDIDAHLIHLVRDPRAVVQSMSRNYNMQTPGSERVEMPKHGAASGALLWERRVLAIELVRRRYRPERSMLLRYEDMTARPSETMDRIASFVGESSAGLNFADGRRIELHGNHTVWGNPSRFKRGPIEVRADEEWRSQLTGANRIIPTGLTLPLLLRYHYPMRPGSC